MLHLMYLQSWLHAHPYDDLHPRESSGDKRVVARAFQYKFRAAGTDAHEHDVPNDRRTILISPDVVSQNDYTHAHVVILECVRKW